MFGGNESFEKAFSKASRLFQCSGLQFFPITSSGKRFGYQESGVSTKFKILFAVLTFVLMVFAGIWIFLVLTATGKSKNSFENKWMLLRIIFPIAFEILLLHSYLKTQKTKQIFRKSAEISNLIKRNFNINIDHGKFGENFMKLVAKTIIFFTIGSISVLISISVFESKSYVFVAALYIVFPYFVMHIFYLRFIFFIMVVLHNIQNMKMALECLHDSKKLENHFDALNFCVKPAVKMKINYCAIASLKEVYGIIWEVSELVNELSGPSLIGLLFTTIMSNTSAGLKIYLASKGASPVSDIGSIELP